MIKRVRKKQKVGICFRYSSLLTLWRPELRLGQQLGDSNRQGLMCPTYLLVFWNNIKRFVSNIPINTFITSCFWCFAKFAISCDKWKKNLVTLWFLFVSKRTRLNFVSFYIKSKWVILLLRSERGRASCTEVRCHKRAKAPFLREVRSARRLLRR